jgi:hypothetical protein
MQCDTAAQAVPRRREQWKRAVLQVRECCLSELNRARVIDQVATWRIAGELRAYARKARTHASMFVENKSCR